MTISIAQAVRKNALTNTITATGTGHGLIVCIGSFNDFLQGTITSVKLGTTSLTQAVTKTDTTQGFSSTWIYYLPNAPSGQTSLVVAGSNLTVDAADGSVDVIEVTGLAPASILDVTNVGNGSGSAYSVASGALAQPEEIIFGIAEGVNMGAASGWTMVGTPNGSVTGYKIVSSATSQTFTGSVTAGGWSGCVASFKAPSSLKSGVTGIIASML
jgi:hypothetical protein